MTRRELLQQRIAEAQSDLQTVEDQINDPNTPPSRMPSLEARQANLERRISEMKQELVNLPAGVGLMGLAGVASLPSAKPKAKAKTATKKRTAAKRPRTPKAPA